MARPTGFEPAISSVTGRRDGPASLQAQNSRRIVAKPLGFCNSRVLTHYILDFRVPLTVL